MSIFGRGTILKYTQKNFDLNIITFRLNLRDYIIGYLMTSIK